jgi:hypothetical protein
MLVTECENLKSEILVLEQSVVQLKDALYMRKLIIDGCDKKFKRMESLIESYDEIAANYYNEGEVLKGQDRERQYGKADGIRDFIEELKNIFL